MAKRQSASLPNYGPNTALIEGAKLVYGTQNQPVKPTKIDMSGVDALRERANAYRQEQTAKINKEETRMANYLANMSYMDTGVVPENYLPQVQSALKEYKDEYFQVSQQLSQLKSSDPEYQNLNIRLLEINNGIKSIANTFTDQKKNKKDDLLMFDPKNNKKLSILNDAKVPGIVEGVGSILRNEAPMKIENGVVKYELNGEWVKYEDIPELQYRADDEAGKIGTMLSTLSTNTPKQGLTSEQLAGYRSQIGNMLNNQDVMLSLALDDFEGYDLGLNLSAYEIQQNPSAAKEQILDKYMSMVEKAAAKGKARNTPPPPTETNTNINKFLAKIGAIKDVIGENPPTLDDFTKWKDAGKNPPFYQASVKLDAGGAKLTTFSWVQMEGKAKIQAISQGSSEPRFYNSWDEVEAAKEYYQ
jgi:hypothetical protein